MVIILTIEEQQAAVPRGGKWMGGGRRIEIKDLTHWNRERVNRARVT